MSAIEVVFYCDGSIAPVLEWLEGLPDRAYAKGVVRIGRLGELGYELRRPEADYLRDGIYELRWALGHVNYRILYFFSGREAVVLANGLTKESEIPDKEIDLAVKRKIEYLKSPEEHAYFEGIE